MSVAVVLGPAERRAIEALRTAAAKCPVDAAALQAKIGTPEGKAAHMEQMTAQSCRIPPNWLVTYSVEIQPPGLCRHMSVSLPPPKGGIMHPVAIWTIAEELGFTGGFQHCKVWQEELNQGLALNLLQVISERHPGGNA